MRVGACVGVCVGVCALGHVLGRALGHVLGRGFRCVVGRGAACVVHELVRALVHMLVRALDVRWCVRVGWGVGACLPWTCVGGCFGACVGACIFAGGRACVFGMSVRALVRAVRRAGAAMSR